MFEEFLYIGLIICVIVVVYMILKFRVIVDPRFADVVIRRKGYEIYSADATITGTDHPKTVYYHWPKWFPFIGVYVKRMPLEVIEIPIVNYKTFAKGNARFAVDVSVYCRIKDVLEAAQKFPGNSIDEFKDSIKEIIVASIRKATSEYAVEDVINKRQEIANNVLVDIRDDIGRWGVELYSVAIGDIGDPYVTDAKGNIVTENGRPVFETTVIHDIAAKKEAEINSLSRQEVANKKRAAEVVEAETRETAVTRSIQADEAIGMREQSKNQSIAVEEQKATAKKMEVERTETVLRAEIQADALVKKADGEKRATIQIADGNREKFIKEGEGQAKQVQAVGTAEAEVVKAKKFAEADGLSRYADAQAKQQELAVAIRTIEKEEKVGLAIADALKAADIKYFGSGHPKDFMDLFTTHGGLSAAGGAATFLEILKSTNPKEYEVLQGTINKIRTGTQDVVKSKSEDKKVETPRDIDLSNIQSVSKDSEKSLTDVINDKRKKKSGS